MLSQWMDQIGQFCMEMQTVASEKIEDIGRCVSLHLYISQVRMGRGWGGWCVVHFSISCTLLSCSAKRTSLGLTCIPLSVHNVQNADHV